MPSKVLEEFECYEDCNNLLSIITSFHPDIIEGDIIKFLIEQKITPVIDNMKYKIKFDIEAPMETLKNRNYKVSVCIRIIKCDEE